MHPLCQASSGSGEGVVKGRVVYLAPPDDPLTPVTQGTAVIHTGEFLGQRVEFDRSVCVAYGFPLAKADLSHIISSGKVSSCQAFLFSVISIFLPLILTSPCSLGLLDLTSSVTDRFSGLKFSLLPM
jgi:hypothetical protein